ncbi:MAG: ATP-dependent helicase [Myxococcaceae bacterium]|nr:ATP-dependent helicase [Myxococcaceae bacterium]
MTFTEAAVEVLRLVGKPLHYKKITEVAIERNMLSHVGKTPEVTMSSRLATMVKRDRGEAPIIKVKPGVFGLREFNEEQLADLSGDVDELPEVELETEQERLAKALETAEGSVEQPAISPSIEPRKPLPGADVFPEEEDDDEPILGGDDDDDDEEGEAEEGGAAAQPGAESRSSRRRRKRRRRGGAEEAAPEPEVRSVREPREEAPRQLREAREPRNARERNPREGRDEPRRDDRARGRSERNLDRGAERNFDRGARDEPREERREREEPLDSQREPGDGDLLGKDLADAVASVLTQGGPRGFSAMRIADLLVRKGRLSGEPSALVPTIMASVRADIARKRVEQTRPRFRLESGAVVLTEFLLPQDVLRAEQDVLRAAERQRERTRRAFVRKLSELPGAGMAELIATWLNAEGVVGLRAVRRPGAGVGELHLAGTLRRGADEVRLAIVVYREARELSRERVIEARGSLHYYGNASTSWLVTFGTVTSGAREEASAPAAGPVALYDGLALATAMERQGVGLVTQQVAISALDFELLESLRGGQAVREAPRDFDQERGRGRDRDRGERGERERDRGERDRHERDHGERERPRLTLERPRPSEEEIDVEQVESFDEQGEDDVSIDEGDEVIEAVMQEAAAASAEGGTDEAGEAREGGRRRRRRRRRKGGRGAEGDAQAAGEIPAGEEGGESEEPGEEREAASWGDREEGESEDGGERDEYPRAEHADDERPIRYDEHHNDGDSLLPREPASVGEEDDEARDEDDEHDDDERDDERDDDERDDDRDRDDEESDQESEQDSDHQEREISGEEQPEGSKAEGDSEGESHADDDDSEDPYTGRRGHG